MTLLLSLSFSLLSPSDMTALGAVGAARVLVALVAAALCSHPLLRVSATLNSVLVNSNAIKNLPPPLGGAAGHPGSAVSVAPGILYEGGNKYQTIDNYQVRRVSGIWGRCDPKGVSFGSLKKGVELADCVRFRANMETALGSSGQQELLERWAERNGDERPDPGVWVPGCPGASPSPGSLPAAVPVRRGRGVQHR